MPVVNYFSQPTGQTIGATLNDANLGQAAPAVNLTPQSSAGGMGMSPDMLAKMAQYLQKQPPGSPVDNTTYAAAPIQGLGQISMSDLPPIYGSGQ